MVARYDQPPKARRPCPGDSTDVLARAIAPRLQAQLGQPVVVKIRPGAGGNIATGLVVRARPPIGYTLLLGAINPTLYGNLPFHPAAGLTDRLRGAALASLRA